MNPLHTVTCTRRIEWDSAHRVLRHESKCATLHGHHYVALVTCIVDELDGLGRVVDFGVVKEKVGGWVDEHWDHATLVNVEDVELRTFCDEQTTKHGHKQCSIFHGEPTAEMIASELAVVAYELLSKSGVRISEVTVFETPNCSATAHVETVIRLRKGRPPGVPEKHFEINDPIRADTEARLAQHREKLQRLASDLRHAPVDEHTADTIDRTHK